MGLPKYNKSDLGRLSWTEYSKILDTLHSKVNDYVKSNNIKVDAIVPILRGAGIAGTFLAYKLHLLTVLPVQFKYLTVNGKFELQNLTKLQEEVFKISESPTFLLIENNHCFGNTAKAAVAYLKSIVPNCKIIYIAAVMDYSNQEMPGAEIVFYGKLSNEARGLSEEQAKEKGISMDVNLFPWENEDEELAMLNEENFEYK